MAVLTQTDHQFFDDNGYVVLKDAVPPENRRAVMDAIFQFLEMDEDNPDDWYRPPLTRGGMLEMYQHPALWNNRQYPRVHQAFTEILGSEKLWVSFDRANFNPPLRDDKPEYGHPGMVHWDIDPTQLDKRPFGVQGVLYLTDTPAERGGFCCAPGHHKLLEKWAKTGEPIPGQPSEKNPHVPANQENVNITPIAGDAGDLVIWSNRLLHGNGQNRSDQPRFAQYITMFPAQEDNEAARQDRIRRWRERLPPDAEWAPGDPRQWEQKNGTTAELTPLGRKLLGMDRWK